MQIFPIKYVNISHIQAPVAFKRNDFSMEALRNLENVNCIYCGQVMLTAKQIKEFANKAEKLKGIELAKLLIEYQPLMKRNERKAACMIKEELKKHPDADLKDILRIMYPRHVALLENQQKKVLLELEKIAVDFPKHDKELTMNYVRHGLKKIKSRKENDHFKRNHYISMFFMLKDAYSDFGNYIKIINAIKSMPNTHSSTDAFIVKYSRKTPYEIATRLLTPNQVTWEHILPQSLGGTNELGNIVLCCGHDNSTRRSQSLDTMRDGLSVNMSKHLQSLRKAISQKFPENQLIKAEEYIQKFKDRINSLLIKDINIYDPSKGRYFDA